MIFDFRSKKSKKLDIDLRSTHIIIIFYHEGRAIELIDGSRNLTPILIETADRAKYMKRQDDDVRIVAAVLHGVLLRRRRRCPSRVVVVVSFVVVVALLIPPLLLLGRRGVRRLRHIEDENMEGE